MAPKKLGKYLAYALGEIILVVIGILIAVSINNWNENSKKTDELKTYLATYKIDLVKDTTSVGKRLRSMEEDRKLYGTFLQRNITKDDYIKNPKGINLILKHRSLYLQQKGFHLLQGYVSNDSGGQDSLVARIVTEHAYYTERIDETQQMILGDIAENINYLKNNKFWVSDLLTSVWSNPEMLDYYVSKEYRNRLAVHNSFVNGNFLPMLNRFQTQAKETLQMIDERLEE